MAIIFLFILGIANFAMHRAAVESGHPVVTQSRQSLSKFLGPHGSYILEFVMLLMAMSFANMGSIAAPVIYGIYTAMNVASAWFIIKLK